jgi:hypothetical protein
VSGFHVSPDLDSTLNSKRSVIRLFSAEREDGRSRLKDLVPPPWRGEVTPDLPDANTDGWTVARTFWLHCREGWVLLVVCLVSVGPLWGDRGSNIAAQMAWAWLPLIAMGAAYGLAVLRWGGTMTIEPTRHELVLRRPKRGGGATTTWAYSEIESAEPRRSAFGDAVRIRVDGRSLLLRVPRGSGEALARGLRGLNA